MKKTSKHKIIKLFIIVKEKILKKEEKRHYVEEQR